MSISNICSLCLGKHILTYQHVRSRQHLNNIRKLPMEVENEWWKWKYEDLFQYLNRNKN